MFGRDPVITNVTAINAMQCFIALLLVAQIDAGPSPSQLGEPLRVYRYGMDTAWDGMMGGSIDATPRQFPIARYLAVANYLQSLPERERATWLRMAAAHPSLAEPAVYLSRMLIDNDDHSLRCIYAYVGKHRAGKPDESFPDAPIELFEGIPFLVASNDVMGTGQAEPSSDYIEYLLANGSWRKTRFSKMPTEKLVEVGRRYISALRDQGHNVDDGFERSIMAQCMVPLQPKKR
ncbi:hypothetical protein [Roseiconus lacunae]|uniref:hypothetical protein n=1 Tax=Roseiconus lacunae TaxID=2605694 RepID=UPI001E3786EA|nr:hypothetical protein [Roseiconus lacunae]MCD0457840.1 hypothetical protein [Roseiconus lacunae]